MPDLFHWIFARDVGNPNRAALSLTRSIYQCLTIGRPEGGRIGILVKIGQVRQETFGGHKTRGEANFTCGAVPNFPDELKARLCDDQALELTVAWRLQRRSEPS